MRIRREVEAELREGKSLTRDLGGTASTMQYADAVVARMNG